jgi:hypothetical protein
LPETRISGLAASSHWLRNVSCLVEARASQTELRANIALRDHLLIQLGAIRQHLREATALRRLSLSAAPGPLDNERALFAAQSAHAPRDVSGAVECLRLAVSTLNAALRR